MKIKNGKSFGLILIAAIFFLPDVVEYFFYKKAEGTVTKMNNGIFGGLKGQQASYNFPTVRFMRNNSVCFYDYNSVLFTSPQVGDKITVLYTDASKEIYLNLPGSYWFPLQKILLFGLSIIAWIGLANIIWMKPKKKRSQPQ